MIERVTLDGGWHYRPMIPFDFEGTHTDPKQSRPVSAFACVVNADPNTAVHRWGDTDWLIDPEIEIPEEATAVHGITTEQARRDGTPAAQSIETIMERLIDLATENLDLNGQMPIEGDKSLALASPIVGMNLSYDLTLMHWDARRHGVPTFEDRCRKFGIFVPVIDIYVLDKHLDRWRKGGRKLVDLCATYGVKHGGAHDAGEDALAAARIAVKIARQTPQIAAMDLQELHGHQVTWRREQCASLQQYFRTRGGKPDAVVDPCWPTCYGHQPAEDDGGLF